MNYRIDTKTGRKALTPRREPYWQKLATRQHLGFRKSENGGSWVARKTFEGTGKREYESLGDDLTMSFDDAIKAAYKWFDGEKKNTMKQGQKRYTVKSAIEAYIEHLKIENSARSAYDTECRLNKHVPDDLKNTPLARLTTESLIDWRNSMVKQDEDPETVRKSKDTANRTLNSFKAALNLAWRNGKAKDDAAWRKVTGFRKVGEARKLFLKPEEIKKILDSAKSHDAGKIEGCKPVGGLFNFVQMGVFTGCRPGGLISTTKRDFNHKDGSLFIPKDKGHTRTIYLSDDANKLLKEITKDLKPDDPIFTRGDGKVWNTDDYQRPFKEILKDAEAPAETDFYAFRHYYASRALLASIPPQVVAENIGTSVRMLEKHYGKFMKTDRRAMLNKVEL